jgi:hypothetical protein
MEKLDKWDFELILLCKTCSATMEQAKEIWSRRCAIDAGLINTYHLLSRMVDILLLSGQDLRLMEMIADASPENVWKFSTVARRKEDLGAINATDANGTYFLNWFRVFASRIALTEVWRLPGYVVWHEQVETKQNS